MPESSAASTRLKFVRAERVDNTLALDLRGIKENVILGCLIPAGTGLSAYQRLSIALDEKAPDLCAARPGSQRATGSRQSAKSSGFTLLSDVLSDAGASVLAPLAISGDCFAAARVHRCCGGSRLRFAAVWRCGGSSPRSAIPARAGRAVSAARPAARESVAK
jgi:hypothetical protein